MVSESQKSAGLIKARIGALVILCAGAVILWGTNWYLLSRFITDQAARGQFGDMFGAVNALFTALAFAGLIYTVLLQRDQLALQQREIVESGKTQKELVKEQIEAQKELFERQKTFQEEQRKKQIDHELKLEQLRQEFEGIIESRRKDREKEDHDRFANNVLLAIRRELEILSDIHGKGIGMDLRSVPDGEVLNVRFAFSQDYFTVFESNAVHLGKVPADAAKRIIKIYAFHRALVAGYRINNIYLETIESIGLELEDIHLSAPNVPQESRVLLQAREPALRFRLKQTINRAVAQASTLKKQDELLTKQVAEFMDALDRLGIR